MLVKAKLNVISAYKSKRKFNYNCYLISYICIQQNRLGGAHLYTGVYKNVKEMLVSYFQYLNNYISSI